MKKIFFVVVIEESGKFFAFANTVQVGQNLLGILDGIENKKIIHLCESREQAEELSIFWNDCFKQNKTYLY